MNEPKHTSQPEAPFAASGGSTKEPDWCNRCAGSGKIHVSWDWSSGVEEHVTERCPECGGRGWYDDDLDDEALW